MSRRPRVAVLCAEGQHANWPADLDVRCYESTARDAARVADMMRKGTVIAVVIANKAPNHNVVRLMPKNLCPVHLWRGGLPALANGLHALLGIERVAALPPAPKKKPRDPEWSASENDSIVLALAEANGDLDLFLSSYAEIEDAERAPEEMYWHIDKLSRNGFLKPPDALMLALRERAGVAPPPPAAPSSAPVPPAADFAAVIKQAVAMGVLTIDEAIDRAIAMARKQAP